MHKDPEKCAGIQTFTKNGATFHCSKLFNDQLTLIGVTDLNDRSKVIYS